ncbi:GTP-binding domain [Tunisvirus fontaine2]|uniref:Putative DNA recombination-mediator protein A n=1 Tax=Tunisvirus fontaine2 TaxID=1421067 RepID=V9SDN7_9VIRU|nr:GTP-binding domain [Tunisvirus fontaine2]AHC54835.1 putative DNA recombination-mediator protein A [Tunisvirus fontaine2]
MKIGIVGGRDFCDRSLFSKELRKLWKQYNFTCVVSGGAKGADSLAEKWARHKKVELIVHPPKDKTKAYSYIERNKEIVGDSDFLVAFWDGESRGTNSTINFAKEKGIPVHVVPYGKLLGPPSRVKIQRKDGQIIHDCDIWIGRKCTMGGWNLPASPWANLWKLSEYSREESLTLYRKHAKEKLWERLGELSGKTLGCFCKETEDCHGDILVELWKEKYC